MAQEGGRWIVIGVSSFVLGSCGTYVDFAVRIARYAPWAASEIRSFDTCSDSDVHGAFARWPVPAFARSAADLKSRCFRPDEAWACKSGGCIAWALRCDGRDDCSDGSDEILGCSPEVYRNRCHAAITDFVGMADQTKDTYQAAYFDYLMKAQRHSGAPPSLEEQRDLSTKCKAWYADLVASTERTGYKENSVLFEACAPMAEAIDNFMGFRSHSVSEVVAFSNACEKQIVYTDSLASDRNEIIRDFKTRIQKCSWADTIANKAMRPRLDGHVLSLSALGIFQTALIT